MQPPKRRSGQIVVPGEPIGVIEEFSPGMGTYVENGKIYSKIVGRTLVDMMNRKVSVYPLVRGASVPKTGNIVLGQVQSMQSHSAVVRIWKIGDKVLSGFFSGLLHISDASPSYVDSMFDVCKPCDIVRAKVISEKNRVYHLSTADRNLGVVYAFCSNCGHLLQFKRHKLQCINCGKIEKRKTALDYAKGEI
jgi:exosome complex component CSL4